MEMNAPYDSLVNLLSRNYFNSASSYPGSCRDHQLPSGSPEQPGHLLHGLCSTVAFLSSSHTATYSPWHSIHMVLTAWPHRGNLVAQGSLGHATTPFSPPAFPLQPSHLSLRGFLMAKASGLCCPQPNKQLMLG